MDLCCQFNKIWSSLGTVVAFVWPGVAGRGVLQVGSAGPWPCCHIRAGFLLCCPSPSRVLSKTPIPGLTGFLPCGLFTPQVVEAIKAADVINTLVQISSLLSSWLQTVGFQMGG